MRIAIVDDISDPGSALSCKALYCKPILNFKLTFYTFIC